MARRTSTTTAAFAAAFLLLALLNGAHAFPWLWAAEAPTCLAHPSTPLAGHKAPVKDSSVTFALTDPKTKKAVTTVCPGASYTVTVRWVFLGVFVDDDGELTHPPTKKTPLNS